MLGNNDLESQRTFTLIGRGLTNWLAGQRVRVIEYQRWYSGEKHIAVRHRGFTSPHPSLDGYRRIKRMELKCEAERLGLKTGNTIFLVAGTRELVCKNCKQACLYTLRDYSKREYQQALSHKKA